MAEPIGGRLSAEFRRVYEDAGLTQTDLAEKLEINQATVSEWARGTTLPRVTALPMIERICGVPRGTILRRAGFVDDIELQTIEDVINADPVLSDPDKKHLLSYYQFIRAESALSAR